MSHSHRPRDNSYIGSTGRPSNTRAPVQVTREAQEQQRVGEIDRDQVGDRAVHPEQHDRTGAQQVREAPPRDRADLQVLHPGEQQQQAEDRLDVDGDEEKRVDVEIHRTATELKTAELRREAAHRPAPSPDAAKNR